MCTVIKYEQQITPLVAKRDMIVYKVCRQLTGRSNIVRSIFYRFEYEIDVVYKDHFTFKISECPWDDDEKDYRDMLSEEDIPYTYIARGFHSLRSLNRERLGYGHRGAVCKFVIPKGAQYYQNEIGNIVSDAIIFKKIITPEKLQSL